LLEIVVVRPRSHPELGFRSLGAPLVRDHKYQNNKVKMIALSNKNAQIGQNGRGMEVGLLIFEAKSLKMKKASRMDAPQAQSCGCWRSVHVPRVFANPENLFQATLPKNPRKRLHRVALIGRFSSPNGAWAGLDYFRNWGMTTERLSPRGKLVWYGVPHERFPKCLLGSASNLQIPWCFSPLLRTFLRILGFRRPRPDP
jgi:hypothetical protein